MRTPHPTTGVSQAEVARRVGVHRQSVSRWAADFHSSGVEALRSAGRAGRRPRLSDEDIDGLGDILESGPEAAGYATNLWTCERVAEVIELHFGVRYHSAHVWRLLVRIGWSCSDRPDAPSSGMRRPSRAGSVWNGHALKKASREARTIIFIDESGLSERPYRVRTWGRRGQTPILQHRFSWKSLSAIAGVTWWNFYFQIHPGAIRSEQAIAFLRALMRHIPSDLLIVWDGLRVHWSRAVREFAEEQQGRIHLERLPAYAPELNPVEYLWDYWKKTAMAKLLPTRLRPAQHPRSRDS